MKKAVIAMPVYNESEIIEAVVTDYLNVESSFQIEVVVVDDYSTDETFELLRKLESQFHGRLHISRNLTNLGHGPTFCNALELSLLQNPYIVISCDGDGPISKEDLSELLNVGVKYEVLEIVRKNRVEPQFRKLVSFITRVIVFLKCGSFPLDANTPLRIYRAPQLIELLPYIKGSKVPNLLLSIMIRKNGLELMHSRINVKERKLNQIGTMWGKSLMPRSLPNLKFLKFAAASLVEVLKFQQRDTGRLNSKI